jgi:hypothetical protein
VLQKASAACVISLISCIIWNSSKNILLGDGRPKTEP